jgi:sugar phosphate isomerase/epimerase
MMAPRAYAMILRTAATSGISMRLAYSTNAFTRHSLDRAIDIVAGLGYAGVEILCDRPHWFAPDVRPAEAEAIAARLEARGLAVSNLNANTANGYFDPAPPENVFEPALSNPDRELRRWRQDYTLAAIELARRVGAPCVSVTSGRPRPGCPPARAFAHLVESLKRICDGAERAGVRVGVEYEPGLLVERAEEVRAVIDAVGSEVLGVNLDVGHSWLDGENPEDAVRLLAGRIWNVHVEDIKGMKHYHLVPGDGELPFERYLEALGAAGFDGFLTVELYTCLDEPEEAGRRALAYLSERLR